MGCSIRTLLVSSRWASPFFLEFESAPIPVDFIIAETYLDVSFPFSTLLPMAIFRVSLSSGGEQEICKESYIFTKLISYDEGKWIMSSRSTGGVSWSSKSIILTYIPSLFYFYFLLVISWRIKEGWLYGWNELGLLEVHARFLNQIPQGIFLLLYWRTLRVSILLIAPGRMGRDDGEGSGVDVNCWFRVDEV